MQTFAYGPGPEQVGDLYLPEPRDGARVPVAAVWHGGGYVPEVGRELMEGVCQDLARRGWAAWNLEYRRVDCGGGWPATWDDVAAGLDRLEDLARDGAPLNLDRVAGIGFSAGAPLALWAAQRRDGRVRLQRVVNQAGLSQLEDVARAQGISGHVQMLLGDPDRNAAVYAQVDPGVLLPLGVPQLHVHGDADENIPVDLTRRFVDRACLAGDEAELVVIEGETHFDHADPASQAWQAVVAWLEAASPESAH